MVGILANVLTFMSGCLPVTLSTWLADKSAISYNDEQKM